MTRPIWPTPLCTVPGCDRPSRDRHLCTAHYQRWRTHGDVDAARPIDPRKANNRKVVMWTRADVLLPPPKRR